MKNRSKDNIVKIAIGTLLCLGITLGGWFIGSGLQSLSEKDRTITVKGLAEKVVDADYASLRISFECGSDNMQDLLQQIETCSKKVVGFAKSKGLTDEEIFVGVPSINDKQLDSYDGFNGKGYRYYGRASVSITSNAPAKVRQVDINRFDLYKDGVNLESSYYDGSSANYEFTSINQIKPALIKEAVGNARKAASDLAVNSGSKLSKIKSASQGQISVDQTENPLQLKVRVVSTVDYYIK